MPNSRFISCTANSVSQSGAQRLTLQDTTGINRTSKQLAFQIYTLQQVSAEPATHSISEKTHWMAGLSDMHACCCGTDSQPVPSCRIPLLHCTYLRSSLELIQALADLIQVLVLLRRLIVDDLSLISKPGFSQPPSADTRQCGLLLLLLGCQLSWLLLFTLLGCEMLPWLCCCCWVLWTRRWPAGRSCRVTIYYTLRRSVASSMLASISCDLCTC